MRVFAGLFLPLLIGAAGALSACSPGAGQRERTMSTDARLQMAEAAETSGNSDLAIAMYTAAAANEPANVALQVRCADALARSGKTDQARQFLTEKLRTNGQQPDLIRALALIDLVAGKPRQAVAKFNDALAVNPGDVRAMVDKAVALDLLGEHAAAQVLYQQVLATTPGDPATTNDLAISMMLEGRNREALATLAPLQDSDGASPRLKVNLGILYAANGDVERSRQLLGENASTSDVSTLTRALASLPQAPNPALHNVRIDRSVDEAYELQPQVQDHPAHTSGIHITGRSRMHRHPEGRNGRHLTGVAQPARARHPAQTSGATPAERSDHLIH